MKICFLNKRKKKNNKLRIAKSETKIDSGLFEIFVKEGIYKQYAELHVKASHIDSVDESALLN